MKKQKAFYLLLLSMLITSCGSTTSSESSIDNNISSSEETSSTINESSLNNDSSNNESETMGPRKRQEMPTIEIVDKDYNFGDSSTWNGTNYKGKSLGKVYLQDVIDDNVYDWGHSVIFENGVYKMWWVRPGVYDAIFYAESSDLKNWINTQRVICLSPNATNVTKYDNIKGMLGKPSVIHVNDTYYMYFEAPATEDLDITQSVLEWDNQVMLATSKDGINWSFYCDNKGQPQPVVAMEEKFMKNSNVKNYGVGQPSVFYKDKTFYLTYCYVLYESGGKENGIYVATSTDGINFGDIATHKKIANGNGLGITYNTKTNKFMMAHTDTIDEASELDFIDKTKFNSYTYDSYDTTTIQRSFPEFVKNANGLVDTETFYTIQLSGAKSTTDDWRAGYTTWDGYICAVNPCEYENKMITLPNGAAATEANLKGYKDRANSYNKPSADAIYANDDEIKIDGLMDEIYKKATKIEITRPVYGYGSNLTSSWAEAYVAWNENYLYVYANVYDETFDTSYGIIDNKQIYMHDSLDVFVDAINDHGNNKNVPYGIEQYMISTDANNQGFMIKGSGEYDLTNEFDSPRHRVKRSEYGYSIELRVPWHDLVIDEIIENKCIGLDFQVNDAMKHNVGREAIVTWADNTGNSFQYVDTMGDVYLIKK